MRHNVCGFASKLRKHFLFAINDEYDTSALSILHFHYIMTTQSNPSSFLHCIGLYCTLDSNGDNFHSDKVTNRILFLHFCRHRH